MPSFRVRGTRIDQMLQGMGLELGGTTPQQGLIFNTVAADGDDCFVLLDNGGGEKYKIGPCPYMPRGAALPTKGSRALVVTDENDEAWIAVWWPYD